MRKRATKRTWVTRTVLAVALTAQVLALVPSTAPVAIAANRPPTTKFQLPTEQEQFNFSPLSGSLSRSLLVIYVRYNDLTTGDADTEASVSRRFFGATSPSFAGLVREASQGRMAFTPAAERSDLANPPGVANNGVVLVELGASPPQGTTQNQMIDAALSAADPYVNYSRFDRLDFDGQVTPDNNGDGRPDGDGHVTPLELTIQVMRETMCPVQTPPPGGICENGGVATRGSMAPRDGRDIHLYPALTTNTTNAITHLHEIFHATFQVFQDYQPDNVDITSGTVSGWRGLTEAWFLASAWTRFRLGWVEPAHVTMDGRYRLEKGEALAIQDTTNPARYILVEGRYPDRVLDEQHATAGVAVWRSEDDKQQRPEWQQLVSPSTGPLLPELSSEIIRPMWSDGTSSSIEITYPIRLDHDDVMSVEINVPGDARVRTDVHPGLIDYDGLRFFHLSDAPTLVPVTVRDDPWSSGGSHYRVRAVEDSFGYPFVTETDVALADGQERIVNLAIDYRRVGSRTYRFEVANPANGAVRDFVSGVVGEYMWSAPDGNDSANHTTTPRATSCSTRPAGTAPSSVRRPPLAGPPPPSRCRRRAVSCPAWATRTTYRSLCRRSSRADERLAGIGDCGQRRVAATGGGEARVLLTSTLFATPDYDDRIRHDANDRVSTVATDANARSARLADGSLSITCPQATGGPSRTDLVMGDRSTPRTTASAYEIGLRYEVHADNVPVAAAWVDPWLNNPRRAVTPMRCPGGFFPSCLGGGQAPFQVSHPINPIPAGGSGCQADGCPDFVPITWQGGIFDAMFYSDAPLDIALVDSAGNEVVDAYDTYGPPSDTSIGLPPGWNLPSGRLEGGRERNSFPPTAHGYSVKDSVPAGWYALKISGPATSYLADVIGPGDNDGDLVPNDSDNCVGATNPGQEDADGDGLGGLCDPTPGPFLASLLGGEGSLPAIAEGAGAGYLRLRLDRPNYTGAPLEVRLSATGSAGPGTDYTLEPTVAIPHGASSVNIPLTVLDDGVRELDESVALSVAPVTSAANVRSLGNLNLTIADDDPIRTTTIVAKPVLTTQRGLLGTPVPVGGVEARLTSAGQPLAGHEVVFATFTRPDPTKPGTSVSVICRAITNSSGVAGCGIDELGDLVEFVRAGEYEAHFVATPAYAASVDKASLLR